MREGRFTDIGRTAIGRAIQAFVQRMRHMGQALQIVGADPVV